VVIGSGRACWDKPLRPATSNSNRLFDGRASIRKNVSGSARRRCRGQPGGRLTVTNNTLRNIIPATRTTCRTFRSSADPDWINNDRWDIVAKAADDAQPQQMLLCCNRCLPIDSSW
jgi:uncharacterized protein (TIGR03435 family)